MICHTYSNTNRAAFLLTLRTSWIKSKTHLSNSKRKTILRPRCYQVLPLYQDRCGLSYHRRPLSKLTPLTQKITPIILLFYDAPTRPVGVFDDFLAIQPAQGNVSTLSYSDFVLNASSFAPPTNTRSVICNPVVQRRLTRYPTLSVFAEGVPVTQYSPAVFDAFVNYTRVSPVLRAFTVCRFSNMMGVHSSGGSKFLLLTALRP